MQGDPVSSIARSAFQPGGTSGMNSFASTASLPDAAEHLADLPDGDHAPSSYVAMPMPTPRRGSVITPAVLQVLEWHRQHHQPR